MDTVARVRELAAQRGLSLAELSRLCGVPYSTLKNTELRGGQLTVPTIELVCTGLGIPLYRFFTEE
jgi:transcriptional regulator with XRE-family HTH domain